MLGQAASVLPSIIQQGSLIDDISSSFENLSAQAGIVSDTFLHKLNAAVDETIPNFQLMKQANELLIGGLKPDEIELVATAARSLGEATGVSAKEGMDQLADSLLRGNDRALKSLGIIIDNDKALRDFAESIGTTTDKLNDQGKAAAIRTASIEALKEQTERLGKASLDSGDKLDQLNKILIDAKDEFFRTAANSKELGAALDTLKTVLKNIDFKPIINGLASVLSLFSKGIELAGNFTASIQKFINKDSELDHSIAKSTQGFQLFDERLKDVIDLLGKDSKEATKKAITEYDKLGKIFVTMTNNGDLLGSQINALNVEFQKTREQVIASARNFDLVEKEQGETQVAAQKLTTEIKNNAEAFIKQATEAAKASDIVKSSIVDAQQTAEENPIEVPVVIGANRINVPGSIGGGSEFGDLGKQIVGSITQGISEALKGGDIGNILSGTLGSIGKSFLGSDFAKSIFGDLGGIGLGVLSPLIDVGTNLLGDAFDHIFGGESAGLTARKAADKFFADAFDANRLGVIIDGQLKEITDLVFKGDTLFGGNVDFTDGSFSNFFESLPDKAREAFGGVGAAFEELLGVGDDIGGQLAAVFANNVGGSLNNLQLLVKASGKSFEELSDSVVKAFNNGKLSALQAQSALQGIANVAQDGIPDGIGFTVQAIENLKAAGVNGGATLIDALKDVGFEAKEIGIKDFGALQANLAASGKFTAEEIAQLFQSLRDHGITSIDQLTKATDQQLIPVLAQLEAQKFPFAEAAEGAGELITQINDLPNEKTLTFNIKTNFDANTKQAQQDGHIPRLSEGPGIPN